MRLFMASNKRIEKLVVALSSDSNNPEKNFKVAVEYEKLKQTASAVAFYLRAAEYGHDSDPDIVYSSLLRISICMNGQMGRDLTVSNSLLQAIEYRPDRPEAYYLMSLMYERSSQWQECYTFARLAGAYDRQIFDLPVDVGYVSWYSYRFQMAVAAWWIGRKSESLAALRKLAADKDCPEIYRKASKDNLDRLDV
jgi:hypothetical protein